MRADMITSAAHRGARAAVWDVLRDALLRTGGDREATAAALGVTARGLYRAIERYELIARVRDLDVRLGRRDWWPGQPRDEKRHSVDADTRENPA